MKEALVVDDHPIVCDGVRELLGKAFPSVVVKGSSGNHDAVKEICAAPWAFVVLDINLAGQNGIDIIKHVKRCCPKIPIVVFSLFPEKQYAARAMRAGAVAYVCKDRSPTDLVNVVRMTLEGKAVKKPPQAVISQPLLSDREAEVLRLFVKGLNRQEIAQSLKISEKTVSTYRARLFSKLQARNIVELVRYAVAEGLVD